MLTHNWDRGPAPTPGNAMPLIPCPNPSCTHNFASEQVQSAGALKCPVCGQVFQFRNPAAPTQPARPPRGKPVAGKGIPPRTRPVANPAQPAAAHSATTLPPVAIPVAKPVAHAPRVESAPLQTAGQADPTFPVFAGDEPLVQPRFRHASSNRRRYLFLGAGVLLGTIVVVTAVLVMKRTFTSGEEGSASSKGQILIGTSRNQKNIEENVFKLILANKTWDPDNDARKRMGVITALKRVKEKDGWLAIAAKDYGLARPREAELLRAGIERLENYFEGAVELEEKSEPAQLSDVPGQRLLFKGQLHAVTSWGYMYMFAHHGFGYWIYVAGPSKEEAEELFARELQGSDYGFVFHTDRNGWREQPPNRESFATGDGAMTITVPEGIFVKHPAKDQDDHGELFLFAKYQKELDNRKNADVLILALAKEADLKDAMTSSKKYLEDKKQEESKEYKIDIAGEGGEQSELGIAAAVGNQPGRIAEFKLLRGEAAARFWIVAVVNDTDKVYVIRCDCNWENRQIWREDFQELLRSVRFRVPPS
jgi:hypothetical protein